MYQKAACKKTQTKPTNQAATFTCISDSLGVRSVSIFLWISLVYVRPFSEAARTHAAGLQGALRRNPKTTFSKVEANPQLPPFLACWHFPFQVKNKQTIKKKQTRKPPPPSPPPPVLTFNLFMFIPTQPNNSVVLWSQMDSCWRVCNTSPGSKLTEMPIFANDAGFCSFPSLFGCFWAEL